MQTYTSSDPAQGNARWIGVIIETGETTDANVTYNGSALSAADDTDAISVGGKAGDIVLWLKADDVASTSKVITLGTADGSKADRTITVKVTLS